MAKIGQTAGESVKGGGVLKKKEEEEGCHAASQPIAQK